MTYIPRGPKRPVNMSLSEDLVREARALTSNLSEMVEQLLAAHVAAERGRRAEKERLIDATIGFALRHYEEHGLIGDDYSPLHAGDDSEQTPQEEPRRSR